MEPDLKIVRFENIEENFVAVKFNLDWFWPFSSKIKVHEGMHVAFFTILTFLQNFFSFLLILSLHLLFNRLIL